MATIWNEKKSSVGSPYVYYTVSYSLGARTATTQIYNITIKSHLQYSESFLGTGSSYGLIAHIQIGSSSAKTCTLKSTDTSWSGTSVKTKSMSYTLSLTSNPTSNPTIKFWVSRSSGSSSGTLSTQTSTVSYTKYSYCSTLGAISDFVFDAPTQDLTKTPKEYHLTFPITINALNSTCKHELRAYVIKPKEDDPTLNEEKTLFDKDHEAIVLQEDGAYKISITENDLNNIYDIINAKSMVWKFTLKTYEDTDDSGNMVKTYLGYNDTKEATVSIYKGDSLPQIGTAAMTDINTTTTTLTGNNTALIKGYSTLNLAFSLTFQKRSTLASYEMTFDGETPIIGTDEDLVYNNTTNILTFSRPQIKNSKFTLKIKDSKGFETALENQSISLIEYQKPTIGSFNVTRTDPEITGEKVKITLSGSVYNWTGFTAENDVTQIKVFYKETTQTEYSQSDYFNLTSLKDVDANKNFTLMGDSNCYISSDQITFAMDKSYDFKAAITDNLDCSELITSIGKAQPTIDIDVENRRVAIGQVIKETTHNGTLELATPLGVESGGTGKSAGLFLDLIYPEGSIYIGTKAPLTNEPDASDPANPTHEFGGTWTLVDKEFSLAEGTDTSTLITKGAGMTSYTVNYSRSGHSLFLNIYYENKVQLADSTITLGVLKLDNLGVTGLQTARVTGWTDGGNCCIMHGISAGGTIYSYDIIPDSYVSVGSSCALCITYTIPHTKMINSHCNKFYWKRTNSEG